MPLAMAVDSTEEKKEDERFLTALGRPLQYFLVVDGPRSSF